MIKFMKLNKNDFISIILESFLTNEKHKKIEAVRIVAVGMMVGLTLIAISRSGRRPAPDVTPNPINFRRRSFWLPCREAK